MAFYDTGKDLLEALGRRAGDLLPSVTDSTGADHLIDSKLSLNKSYLEVCGLKPWRWVRARKQFSSTAHIEFNVNSISGQTVVMASTQTPSMAGRKFFMTSDGIPNRISAHTDGSNTLTLEASYTGSSTSGNGMIYLDEVFIADDILSYPLITELHWGDEIIVIPEGEALSEFPRNIYGAPRALYASFITEDTIRIMPWTWDARLFECAYNKRPALLDFTGNAATDTPVIPRDGRVIILQRALEMIYADKRDARLANVQREMKETLSTLGSTETAFAKPRIHIPRNFRVAP